MMNDERKKKTTLIYLPFIIHHSSFIISLRRRYLLAAVTAKHARRGELTQLVSHHVFLAIHTQKLVSVVNLERMANEFRNDSASSRPSFKRLFRPILI
jgi:hypothetical protein